MGSSLREGGVVLAWRHRPFTPESFAALQGFLEWL